MKTAIVFADGIKQVIFTPENDDERAALKLFSTEDRIELAVKHGGVYDRQKGNLYHGSFNSCHGGYLRLYDDSESLMFVLTPVTKKQDS